MKGWYTYLINKGQSRPPRKGNDMTNTITAKELAAELNTDAKTCRKFLRSLTDDRAGKGGRWEIDAADLDTLKDRFAAFTARRSTTLTLTDD